MSDNPHRGQPVGRWGPAPGSADLVVVALHGREQPPEFIRGVAERIDLPGVHWVAPQADASSWYPLSFLAESGNEPRLGHALDLVAELRSDLLAEGVDPDRLALLGFSQGAVLATEHLVVTGDRWAGAVLLTGGYVGPPGPLRAADPAVPHLAGMPVLLGSAAADELVPLDRVQQSAAMLTAMGAAVELEVYDDLEHVVSDRAVASARTLLLGCGRSG